MHVAPVATDIEHIYEGQAGNLIDVLLQSLASGTRRQRWAAFLPRIAHQAKSGIALWFFRRRGEKRGQSAFILVDVERPLLKARTRRKRKIELLISEGRGETSRRCERGERGDALKNASSSHLHVGSVEFAVDNFATMPESGEAKIAKVKERIKW